MPIFVDALFEEQSVPVPESNEMDEDAPPVLEIFHPQKWMTWLTTGAIRDVEGSGPVMSEYATVLLQATWTPWPWALAARVARARRERRDARTSFFIIVPQTSRPFIARGVAIEYLLTLPVVLHLCELHRMSGRVLVLGESGEERLILTIQVSQKLRLVGSVSVLDHGARFLLVQRRCVAWIAVTRARNPMATGAEVEFRGGEVSKVGS
jgi:hypothetical protein